MKNLLWTITLCWPAWLAGQQAFFLDSLWCVDFNELSYYKDEFDLERIRALRNNPGISGGVRIANFQQQEIDEGLSTRLFSRIEFWNGGMLDRNMEAEILQHKMSIRELEGDEEVVSHKYGLIYNIIIYSNNKEKVKLSRNILQSCEEALSKLYRLYHEKQIDFEPILKLQRILAEQSKIQYALTEWNRVFDKSLNSSWPMEFKNIMWNTDFSALTILLEQAEKNNEIFRRKIEILETETLRQTLPQLSLSGGYDVSRKQPFFALNLVKNLFVKPDLSLDSQKNILKQQHLMENQQKHKELLNLQAEYTYKLKQYENAIHDIRLISEKLRKLEVKKELLSIEESVEVCQLQVDSLLHEYEIQEIKQQSHLVLLNVKRITGKMELRPFLTPVTETREINKYKMERYISVPQYLSLSKEDQLFLLQNEITPVTQDQLDGMSHVLAFNPNNYSRRSELEAMILELDNQGKNQKLYFTDFNAFKELELRTIRQQN